MISSEVQRTLVKSAPELWSELSDKAALERHLSEFGEIRITRVAPEERIDWEAEHARGSILIKSSGWGTRVTLTVERDQPAEARSGQPQRAVAQPAAGDATAAPPNPQSPGTAPAPSAHTAPAPSAPAAPAPSAHTAPGAETSHVAPAPSAPAAPAPSASAAPAPSAPAAPAPRDKAAPQTSFKTRSAPGVQSTLRPGAENTPPTGAVPAPRDGAASKPAAKSMPAQASRQPTAPIEPAAAPPEKMSSTPPSPEDKRPAAQPASPPQSPPTPSASVPIRRRGFFARVFSHWHRTAPAHPSAEEATAKSGTAELGAAQQSLDTAKKRDAPVPPVPALPIESPKPAAQPDERGPVREVERPDAAHARAQAHAGARAANAIEVGKPDTSTPPSPVGSAAKTPAPPAASEPANLSAELRAAEEAPVSGDTAVLTAVLDSLGSAHHRPFSRS